MLEKLIETQRLANQLMKEHGLLDKEPAWTFGFSNEKTAVGRCYLSQKKIVYSKWYIDSTDDSIRQTLLHEIAHALVYEEVGKIYKHGSNDWHGRTWRKKALEIGCRPERVSYDANFNGNYNWLIECKTEDCEAGPWRRHRLKNLMWYAKCPNCGSSLWILDLKTGDIYESQPYVSHSEEVS
jgi:predicted SprT family Zn-dependent metalloprotease